MRAGNEAERETFLAQVLKDALEDPDGVPAWANVTDLRWFLPGLEDGTDEPAPRGGANVHATINPREWTRVEGPPFEVSPQVIAQGYNVLMATGPNVVPPGMSRRERDRLLEARSTNNPLMLDGFDGDTLVQLGLWGEIRY